MITNAKITGLTAAVVVALAGCAVGPDYVEPSPELEASFKNAGFTQPPPEGSWWRLFGDAKLNALMAKAEADNPSAQAALARYDQARAALGLAAADAFPALTADGFATRSQESGSTTFSSGLVNDFEIKANFSWEIDLWGRVRRQMKAAEAEWQAAGYEYRGALLSLRGELARTYLSLRFADAEIRLLENTASIRQQARKLMKSHLENGVSSEIDYQRAITEHESVLAELEALRADRKKLEHAIAALTGENASGFDLAARDGRPQIPAAVAAVPSDLLRRRPDLAVSERQLAAASERIGLTVASYLPRVTIGGDAGFRSQTASDLFDPSSQIWSLGPEVSVPIFQGGQLSSDRERAEAEYREALANYRDTLLAAIRETEDAMADMNGLAKAAKSRAASGRSAARAAELTRKRYGSGIADYFELVDADRTQLTEQRAQLETDLARALAATQLIQALGGGWER